MTPLVGGGDKGRRTSSPMEGGSEPGWNSREVGGALAGTAKGQVWETRSGSGGPQQRCFCAQSCASVQAE